LFCELIRVTFKRLALFERLIEMKTALCRHYYFLRLGSTKFYCISQLLCQMVIIPD